MLGRIDILAKPLFSQGERHINSGELSDGFNLLSGSRCDGRRQDRIGQSGSVKRSQQPLAASPPGRLSSEAGVFMLPHRANG
jgi:hypothetical protein